MNTLTSATCCPYCGSTNIENLIRNSTIPVPYASPAQFKTEQILCKDCGMDTDISDSKEVQNAIDQTTQASIPEMIDSFASDNLTLSKIEHSLDLPERTLSRWKYSKKLSKESIVLLRILRTYPWIVKVADRKFENSYAQRQVLVAAYQISTLTIQGNSLIGFGYCQFQPESFKEPITMVAALYGNSSNIIQNSQTLSMPTK